MADEKPAEGADKKEPEKTKVESAPSQDEWSKLVEGKYKTPEELAKAHKELEKKLSQQGDELAKSREFQTVVTPLLETIRDDAELFQAVDKKMRDKTKPADTTKTSDTKDNKSSDEVRTVASDMILERFETKYGIPGLEADKRADIRKKIGDKIYELTGQPLNLVDLRRLPNVLEDAYFLANKEDLIEKGKLEALVSAKGADEARIGNIPSKLGKNESETLTPEETKVAEKMGLTREQYLEGKKKVQQKA